MHFIVKNERLKTGTEQRCRHARAFIDQVPASKGGGKARHAFLHAILRVDGFGVGHRTRDTRGQAQPIGQLRGCGIQHGGFPATPRERATAQIDDQRPVGKDHRKSGRDHIDHHKACQRFGQRLRKKPCQCGRRSRPGLRCGDARHRNIVLNAFVNNVDRIFAKPHG